MSPECSTNSIRDNLDGLSLNPNSSQEGANTSQIKQSTKSLLSESLAGETQNTKSIPHYHSFNAGDVAYTDEHPEPALLATSVGKDSDGRLIPSSSTISLLSLSSNQGSIGPITHASEVAFSGAKPPPLNFSSLTADRANSYTNLRSRNSITHLNQQRLQPYHKLTSPTSAGTSEFPAISSPAFIPMARNSIYTPDSPNLDPISGNGSPSRFWLTSQTPPKAGMSSLRTQNKSSLMNFTSLPKVQEGEQISSHSVSQAIAIHNKGNQSPLLNPVSTPSEDLPMTPLFLNHGDHYFIANKPKPDSELNTQDYYYAEKFSNLPFEDKDGRDEEMGQ